MSSPETKVRKLDVELPCHLDATLGEHAKVELEALHAVESLTTSGEEPRGSSVEATPATVARRFQSREEFMKRFCIAASWSATSARYRSAASDLERLRLHYQLLMQTVAVKPSGAKSE